MFNTFSSLKFLDKFQVYHERFQQFLHRVESIYDRGRPLHIAQPAKSIIKSFSYVEWKALTPVQMQQEQREKNIIVSGWPIKNEISFDEDGLRKVAGTQSRQISINGKEISTLFLMTFIEECASQTIPSNLLKTVAGQLL